VPKYTDGQIIEALEKSRGMVYVAARLLKCSPDTILKRIKDKVAVAEVVQAQAELFVDTAELKLIESVNNGDSWAIQFALKTKGKNRGYVEKQEIDGSGNLTVTVKYENS
jgi:hypothetical protein